MQSTGAWMVGVRSAGGLLLIVVTTALLLGGCIRNPDADKASGEIGPNGERPLQLRISARDQSFDPRVVSVKAGERVNLIFISESERAHKVEVVGLVPPFTLQPGERRNYTVTVGRRSYRIVCHIHEAEGMEAELVGE
ncbi:MAG: cupredoxin domain-containing protein [Chloroflexota bacterium]|nr:cupredoxin domain-containing protein [Chloroflexota bacterium]